MGSILRKKSRDFKDEPFFYLILLSTLLLAIFFRFYNYNDRVYTLSDNSLAVQVARYGADNLKIPLIGQFSSAGPFFYGPWYLLLLELVSFVPLGFLTHWYFISGIYLLFIYLIYLLGREIAGKWAGALSALLAAVSPAQITSSFNVWSPTIIPLLSLISLFFLVRFYKYRKLLDVFLVGLVVGLAQTVHFQSILLTPVLAAAAVLAGSPLKNYVRYIALAAGPVIAFLPLLYFDLKFDWYNFKNILIYLTVDQYKIWLPNRWLIYLGQYWPQAWASIVGGSEFIGAALMVTFAGLVLVKFSTFNRNRIFYLVAFTFLLEVILFRYFRGERFFYYSFFAHAPIIFFTAWTLVELFVWQKFLGSFVIVLVLAASILTSWKDLADRTITIEKINRMKEEIYRSVPGGSFDIYGCELNPNSVSYPLALSMYVDGRNATNGAKVSVCELSGAIYWINIDHEFERDWRGKVFRRSTETVYRDTAEWWKTKPPVKGEGDFWRFIFENSPWFSFFEKQII